MGNSQPALNYFENKILVATINYGGQLANPFQFYSNSKQKNQILKQLSVCFYSLIPIYFPEFSSLTPTQQQNFDFGISHIDERILRNRYSPLVDPQSNQYQIMYLRGSDLITRQRFLELWQRRYQQIIENKINDRRQSKFQLQGEISHKQLTSLQKLRLANFDCLCYHTIMKYTYKQKNIQSIKQKKNVDVDADEFNILMERFFDRGARFQQYYRIQNIIEILSKDFNHLMKLKKQQKSQIPKLIDVLFIQNPTNQLVQALQNIKQKGSRKRKYYIVGKNDLSKCLIVARTSSFNFIFEYFDDDTQMENISKQKLAHHQYIEHLVLPKIQELLNKTKSNVLVCDGYIFLGVNFKKSQLNQASEKSNLDKTLKESDNLEEPKKQEIEVNPGQSLILDLKQNIVQNGPKDKKEDQHLSNDNNKTQNKTQEKIPTQKENLKFSSDIDILKSTLQSFRHFKRQIVIIVGGYIDAMIQTKENPQDDQQLQQIFHYDIYPKYQNFVTSNTIRTFMQLQFKKANFFDKACRSQIMSSCSMVKRARMNIDATPVNQSYLIPNSKHPYLQYLIVSLINNQVKQHQKKILQKRHYLTKYHNTRRKLQGRQSESGFSQKLQP